MRFAICSAAYPEKPTFIADFMAGVEAASRDYPDTELVLAVEYGFDDCPGLADGVPTSVSVRAQRAPRPTTPAELRGQMLTAASTSAADIVIFADFDDRLLPEALGLHARALDDADVSFGDMVLADSGGRPLGGRFFDGAVIPDSFAGAEAIVARNFLGFGNTAVRRKCLTGADLALPPDATPADWWFFTMLMATGLRARRTEGPVSLYRCHATSTLGAEAAKSGPALRARATLALSHYAQLNGRMETNAARRAVEHLIRVIDGGDGVFATIAPALADCPAVWFEDVARAARAVAGIRAGSR